METRIVCMLQREANLDTQGWYLTAKILHPVQLLEAMVMSGPMMPRNARSGSMVDHSVDWC